MSALASATYESDYALTSIGTDRAYSIIPEDSFEATVEFSQDTAGDGVIVALAAYDLSGKMLSFHSRYCAPDEVKAAFQLNNSDGGIASLKAFMLLSNTKRPLCESISKPNTHSNVYFNHNTAGVMCLNRIPPADLESENAYGCKIALQTDSVADWSIVYYTYSSPPVFTTRSQEIPLCSIDKAISAANGTLYLRTEYYSKELSGYFSDLTYPGDVVEYGQLKLTVDKTNEPSAAAITFKMIEDEWYCSLANLKENADVYIRFRYDGMERTMVVHADGGGNVDLAKVPDETEEKNDPYLVKPDYFLADELVERGSYAITECFDITVNATHDECSCKMTQADAWKEIQQ